MLCCCYFFLSPFCLFIENINMPDTHFHWIRLRNWENSFAHSWWDLVRLSHKLDILRKRYRFVPHKFVIRYEWCCLKRKRRCWLPGWWVSSSNNKEKEWERIHKMNGALVLRLFNIHGMSSNLRFFFSFTKPTQITLLSCIRFLVHNLTTEINLENFSSMNEDAKLKHSLYAICTHAHARFILRYQQK